MIWRQRTIRPFLKGLVVVTLEPNDVSLLAKLSDNLLLSGGASGADAAWGEAAANAGHQVVHWSFEGHKSHGRPEHTYKLSEEELKEADPFLEKANLSLGRRLSYHKPWLINLLRRNWYQVREADSVYAVGTLSDTAVMGQLESTGNWMSPPAKDRMGVNGGTAWTCQLYNDTWPERDDDVIYPFQLFLYEQNKREFFQFKHTEQAWYHVNGVIGRPSGIYAAIGSRDLNEYGQAFIEEMYNR